jgi:uncharacterized membrane protein YkvI
MYATLASFIIPFSIMIALAVSFVHIGYYLFRMTLNRKPGVPFADGSQWAGNIILRPHQLTDIGRKAQNRLFVWLGVFVGTLFLTFVIPAQMWVFERYM